MTLDAWNSFFAWFSVWVIALSLVSGAGAVITSNRIAARLRERLVALETDLAKAHVTLAEQQERAAKAELKLEEIRKHQEWRHVDVDAFLAALNGKAKGTVSLSYPPYDDEAAFFANELFWAFTRAGGNVKHPTALIEDQDLKSNAGLAIRGNHEAQTSYVPEAGHNPTDQAANALGDALRAARLSFASAPDDALHNGVFRIIVSKKP